MEKNKILNELKEKFGELKKELKFKASYEQINSMSYIEDLVLSEGYVSNQFSRQLINRMVETFYSWAGNLHAWICPNPMDLIFLNENKQLNPEEKKEITDMIEKIMHLVRKNKRIAFEGKRKEEGEFIDELVEFDKKYFNKFMLKYHKKFEELWGEKPK
jgi:hypothetical protein